MSLTTSDSATADYLNQTPNGRRLEAASLRVLGLPLLFTVALLALTQLSAVRQHQQLLLSFVGAGAALFAWNAVLFVTALRKGRVLTLEAVLRKQHYLQACAQGSVLLYWGWYWRDVYASAYLIAAQLLFAYAFDILLSWSRRDRYVLGFGPFPVVFSINLFLWFRPEWFYLQFAMVALGFAVKELVHWKRDGRDSHIFNPSSLPLAVFSLGLILTGTTGITRGLDIANTQFYPPHMFLMLFLIGLPGQFFFGVTSMTMSAVISTYLFGLAYFAITGTYFFFDSYIPIAVFLGMHLLFTDPSTSPRTELGRIAFGVLYGLSTVGLYQLLGSLGVPTFYDKLLQVPILNLSIRSIDSVARWKGFHRLDPSVLGQWLTPRQRNLSYIGIWATVFCVMSAVQGVGDNHRGQWLPFWQQACAEGRPYACGYLVDKQSRYCSNGSGWACNEVGVLESELGLKAKDAAASIERGCTLGFRPACENAARLSIASLDTLTRAAPTLVDYPIILRGAKGPITDLAPTALYARACAQGWPGSCDAVVRLSAR
jgi:hypothetical protein